MKYLIAGLGNIGAEYELTRHNIGFLVVDKLAQLGKVTFKQDKQAYVAEMKFKGRTIVLIKPTTYMNLSGKAVRYWLQQEKISTENLLVVTDDVALPFGKLRMKAKGSSGGHNGLSNIEELNGGKEYPRLRFGVGDDYPQGGQANYVLGRFNEQEMATLQMEIDRAAEAVLAFCTVGLARAMNQFN